MIHKPPYQNWDCAISCGSTSAIDLIFQILCDPGDLILAEQFTYPGTLAAAKSQGLSVIHVAMDDEGLSATDLDRTLSTWSPPQGAKPQVLYMVPTGQNPTGCTQSNTRRAEIYRIAEEHDLLIIEDDPYYFLQLRSYLNNANYQENMRQQNDEYIATLPMSYLSLDRSGRVIRLDSTSKILAPGLRCGWITACSQVMSKILARTEVSTVAPNGPSQLMLVKLLRQQWDHAGLFSWLRRLSARYHERRDVLLRACERYLPTPMCSWKVPAEGMFVWVTVASDTSTPNAASLSSDECLFLEDRIFVRAKELGVLIGRGSWFQAHDLAATAIQFRLTFAAAKMDELETAVCRFGQALSSFVELGVGTHD